MGGSLGLGGIPRIPRVCSGRPRVGSGRSLQSTSPRSRAVPVESGTASQQWRREVNSRTERAREAGRRNKGFGGEKCGVGRATRYELVTGNDGTRAAESPLAVQIAKATEIAGTGHPCSLQAAENSSTAWSGALHRVLSPRLEENSWATLSREREARRPRVSPGQRATSATVKWEQMERPIPAL